MCVFVHVSLCVCVCVCVVSECVCVCVCVYVVFFWQGTCPFFYIGHLDLSYVMGISSPAYSQLVCSFSYAGYVLTIHSL